MPSHVITFHPDGTAETLWTDKLPLRDLGSLDVERASKIEFNNVTGYWDVFIPENACHPAFSDLSRQACLDWEHEFLNQ